MTGSIRSLGSIALTFIFLTGTAHAGLSLPKDPTLPGGDLIYGNDDRKEIDLYPDQKIIDNSQSVALRVPKKRLTSDRSDPDRILFPFVTLKATNPQICEDEKFIDQVSLGNCSGFLAGPKTLVTAGHCMLNADECTSNKWIFGYKEGVTELKSSQVYACKKIIRQKYVYTDKEVSDYAVIELDREVEGYKPLKMRQFGRVLLGTPLVVVGHPMGLPMKATDGGVVSHFNDLERKDKLKSFILRSHYFTANLDTYGGNSGSPVFNKRTGKVEGILIQGAEDFEYNQEKDCIQSRHQTDGRRDAYEKVMRINKVPGL